MIPVISINRKQQIKKIVCDVFKKIKEPILPVKLGSIIKSYNNIKLITYSSQIKKYNISYTDLIISAETNDSYAVYCKSKNRYCIYYNDIDFNLKSSNRVRWNLAHELGHILLGHHTITSSDKLFRSNISNQIYDCIEEEANYFAQLLLVPHVVLLSFKVQSAREIRSLCKISDKASKRRYIEYINWKKNLNPNDEYDNAVFHFYYAFIYQKLCKNCEGTCIQRYGKYCPICGAHNTLQWGKGNIMKYPKLITHPNYNKPIMCPICKNEETDIEGAYCQICGTYLLNECTSQTCNNHSLESNARYCPICGCQSSFYKNNILLTWDIELESLPFENSTSIQYQASEVPNYDDLPFS
ncbi:MAG: ImmA/IrrE family metallo-endopeptidase [Clostridium sp.]|nr:ImmA/IrrE family metallo-endopeptidase [Clostridium sp.]MCM1459708.1 ImmA/IrrE family metallo-endopeptidase [Bacteroides sp.]